MNLHATETVWTRLRGTFGRSFTALAEALASSSPTESLSRGLRWALILCGISSAVGGIGLPLAHMTSAPTGFRVGLLAALASAGSSVHYAFDFANEASTETAYVDWSQRLSLVTVVLAFVSVRLGRRLAQERPTHLSAVASGAMTGLGFASVMWALSHLATGSLIVGSAFAHITPSSTKDLGLMAAVTGLPAVLSVLANTASRSRSATLAVSMWAARSLRFFALVYFAVLVFAGGVLVIFAFIRPHFAPSADPAPSGAPIDWSQVALGVGAGLMALPALLVALLSVAAGASLGLSIGAPVGSVTSGLLNQILPYDQITKALENAPVGVNATGESLAYWSVGIAGGPYALIALLVVTGLVAYIVGALASRRLARVTSQALAIAVLTFTSLIGCAWWVANTSIRATNHGVLPQDLVAGRLPFDGAYATFGIGLGGLLASGLYLAMFAWLGVRVGGSGMAFAFPYLAHVLRSAAPDSRRRGSWRLFGWTVRLVVTALVVTTLSMGAVERHWAQRDTPATAATQLLATLESGDVAKAKAASVDHGSYTWLPDDVLKDALPKVADSAKTSITNSHDKPYRLGELDAVGTTEITRGKSTVGFPLEFSSNVQPKWRVLRRATFVAKASPLSLTIEVGDGLPKSIVDSVKVNGKSVKPGTYYALPGFYHATADGAGLVAPTDINVAFVDGASTVSVGTKMNLSDKATTDVAVSQKARIDACSESKSVSKGGCFSVKTLMAAGVLSSGSVTDNADSTKMTNVTAQSVTCASDFVDQIVTVNQGTRTWKCKQAVTYDIRYARKAIYELQGRVTHIEMYDPCPSCWWTSSYPIEVVDNPGHRVEIQSAASSTATFKASVAFEIHAQVTLKKDIYSVRVR